MSSKKRSRVLTEQPSEQDVEGADSSAATRIQKKRKSANTYRGYNQRNRLFFAWCKQHRPEALNGDNFIIPLPNEVSLINAFYSTLTSAADKRSKLSSRLELTEETSPEPLSYSYLDGFRSSIISLYTDKVPNLTSCIQYLVNIFTLFSSD